MRGSRGASSFCIAREVEEGVAVVAGDPPERDPGDEPEPEHSRPSSPNLRLSDRRRRAGPRARHRKQHPEREPQRRVHGEHQRRRAEERGHRPGERACEAAHAERAGRPAPRGAADTQRQPRPAAARGRRRARAAAARARAGPARASQAQPHRRSSRATWTRAGFRSSWAKTASTYGGRCGAGDSSGQERDRPALARRRSPRPAPTRSPVRSSVGDQRQVDAAGSREPVPLEEPRVDLHQLEARRRAGRA